MEVETVSPAMKNWDEFRSLNTGGYERLSAQDAARVKLLWERTPHRGLNYDVYGPGIGHFTQTLGPTGVVEAKNTRGDGVLLIGAEPFEGKALPAISWVPLLGDFIAVNRRYGLPLGWHFLPAGQTVRFDVRGDKSIHVAVDPDVGSFQPGRVVWVKQGVELRRISESGGGAGDALGLY